MRLIIVSNRAPVSIIKDANGYHFEESSGGLASGMRTYIEKLQKEKPDLKILWVGWPGATVDNEKEARQEILDKFGVYSIFLSEEVMESFYEGFCNKTIWPLFHYFTGYVTYEKEYWEQYVSVNEMFCNTLSDLIEKDDIIWIHDYHLMLLPAMLRKKKPDATIGFFLHIPFPSYEIFRLLPSNWRSAILEGMYGADLVGFHTHDYQTHFLRSTLRILGYDNHMGEVLYKRRFVKTDTFPMGIDYDKYHSASLSPAVEEEKSKLFGNLTAKNLILSMDRQDYTKGILNRLKGYDYFLQNNEKWLKNVTLIMVVVPSRIGVESYQAIKSQIEEMVGKINGKYGSIEWSPIVYMYRSLSFNELVSLYSACNVALITPLRDGMNLIAKEYIASRPDDKGSLILSEMAGAADELVEAIIVNPNNTEEIAAALAFALEIPEEEQKARMKKMRERITYYSIFKWADNFLSALDAIKKRQEHLNMKILGAAARNELITGFRKASRHVIFLDYDGTLTPHSFYPEVAAPKENVINTIKKLAEIHKTDVVIISGRTRSMLDKWFSTLPVDLVAEHGVFYKRKGADWVMIKPIRGAWKRKLIPLLNTYVEKLPRSFVEEKEFSLAFHYRRCNQEFASARVKELMDHLVNLTSNIDLQILNGDKVLEIRNSGIDKGAAVMYKLSKIRRWGTFILAAGDDQTDEDMFQALPRRAYSIKVGLNSSYASFNLPHPDDLLALLNEL